MSKESIKEKPPIYLLATMVDINRGKNQEEALKVSSISTYFSCIVKSISCPTLPFGTRFTTSLCVSFLRVQTHESSQSTLKVLSDVTIFESCSFVTTWPRSTM